MPCTTEGWLLWHWLLIILNEKELTQRLASLNRCGPMTYISWSSDFTLYLEDCLMDEGHTWYNGSVWHKDWPHKIYIDLTYISWSSNFALYLENYLMDEGHALDNGSVWHKDWPHKIYVGQWPIFRGPVILLTILKTVWWRNIIFGIKDQCDTKVGLIKQMWVSGLYFMVQWFCLTSWRLFDPLYQVWPTYILDIMDQCDTKIDHVKYM